MQRCVVFPEWQMSQSRDQHVQHPPRFLQISSCFTWEREREMERGEREGREKRGSREGSKGCLAGNTKGGDTQRFSPRASVTNLTEIPSLLPLDDRKIRSRSNEWVSTGGWSHPASRSVLGPALPKPIPPDSVKGGLQGMVIAGAGPACAAVLSNPFDVAKVRMQLQGEASSGGKRAFNSLGECLWKTGQREGIRGLQKGLVASVIREGSKNFFRIGLFHPVLDVLHDREVHSTSPPIWKRMVAGSVSGSAGAIICNPIEIVKTRLQASSMQKSAVGYQGYRYSGFVDAFKVIGRNEGVSALWVGTGISTIRSILSTSVNMTVNSTLKEMALEDPQWSWLGFKPGPLTDALCSLVSAFFTVAANNPADVVRTRYNNASLIRRDSLMGQIR